MRRWDRCAPVPRPGAAARAGRAGAGAEHNWELDFYGPRGLAKARMGERPRIDPEAVRQAQPGEAWVIQAGQSIHLRVLPPPAVAPEPVEPADTIPLTDDTLPLPVEEPAPVGIAAAVALAGRMVRQVGRRRPGRHQPRAVAAHRRSPGMLRTPPHPVTAESTADRTERLLAAVRVALVAALTALVLAIAALAYAVSFEAISAFAIETAAFPPSLAWSAPLLVDSFTTAASLVILWRYLRGEGWREPWYAWTLVACATGVSVALNVAHAPTAPAPSCSPPSRRSRCWGRWSC